MGMIANPRQTIIVTCRSKVEVLGKDVEKDNALTVDWHMPVSFTPQLYAISIGKTRFSTKIIQEGKSFVVNFIPFSMKDKATYIGRHTGEHSNKIEEAGLTIVEAEKIDCPIIKDVLAYLECEVIQEIDAGDHIIFIGKVVYSDLIEKGNRLFHIDLNDFTTTK